MRRGLIAKVSTSIEAPRARVWEALVTPALIARYMFGARVVSDWKEGSPITWVGEWQGRRYEDKGVLMTIVPGERLQYSHRSPLSGAPDVPESYHVVSIELSGSGRVTRVELLQDNNLSEEAKAHSEENWGAMLAGLKQLLEGETGEHAPSP